MSETSFRRRECGATVIEYGLLVGILSLSVIIAAGLSTPLTGFFTAVADFFNTII